MKNTTLLLAEGASIDKNTNQWSIFSHIETFSIEDPEKEEFTLRGKFTIVSFWIKEKGDDNKFFELTHEIIDEEGRSLTRHNPIDVEVKPDSRSFKQRIQINKIPFKGEGQYFLRSLIREKGNSDFEESSRIPLKLRYNNQK